MAGIKAVNLFIGIRVDLKMVEVFKYNDGMAILFIKNMVCSRCMMAVQNELDKLGLAVKRIGLGEVELDREPTPVQVTDLDKALSALGFEIIDDRKSRLIERIKM